MFYTQILTEVEVKMVKFHFQVDTKVHMVDIINVKVNIMELNKDTLQKKGSHEGCGESHRSQQPNSDSNYYYY